MSHWLSGFLSVVKREINGICSNSALVFFCFYLPVFWILIVWGLLGQGIIERVPVAFIDNDRTPLSRDVARAIHSQRTMGLETWLEPQAALEAMAAGNVYAVILIPEGYTRDALSGKGGTIATWVDENRYAVGGTIRAGLKNVFSALNIKDVYTSALKTGAGLDNAGKIVSIVHSDFYALGNVETSFLAFLGSTLIPSLVMIAAMLGFLTAFLRELWDSSINDWLNCAHNHITAAIIGKLFPWYAIYALIFLFYMALFAGEGGFNITGPIIDWFLLALGCLAAFASMAVLMAGIAPTWRMALVMGAGYAAPALPYTGFSMPLDSMGEYARMFGKCLPLTWLIQGQAQEWTLGAQIIDLRTPFIALGLIFIIQFSLGAIVINWSYRRHAAKETAQQTE